MPELPEVETVRRGLVPVLDGVVIDRVELRRADLRFPFGNDFCARIGGQTIQRLTRRAKYLLAEFASGDVLLMHLGMTGRFSIGYADAARAAAGPAASTVALGAYVYDAGADQRHDHVVLHLAGGTRVIYNDARRFGFMVLVAAGEVAAHPFLRHLGAEPLGADLTATYLARRAA
ncbi:MAG: DNA-formamidopyrimidine glycosylase family protein, partial [Hyphomicrobium sp.]